MPVRTSQATFPSHQPTAIFDFLHELALNLPEYVQPPFSSSLVVTVRGCVAPLCFRNGANDVFQTGLSLIISPYQ